MVDVSAKVETRREAVASAFVELNDAVLAALPKNPKGNPLEVARFAGIQAAKKTSELIPMCHPLRAELCRRSSRGGCGRRCNSRDSGDDRGHRSRDGSDDRGSDRGADGL